MPDNSFTNQEHTWEIHQNCETPYCPICEGGLDVCSVCGLIEGSLTTHCPGKQVFHEKSSEIYEGKIDFRNGAWVNKCSPYSPNTRQAVKGGKLK